MRDRITIKGLCDLVFHVKSQSGGSGIHTVVEIGSFSGESTFIFCSEFPEVHAVDSWDYSDPMWNKFVKNGEVGKIEEQFDMCCAYWGQPQLTKHKGSSLVIAKTWVKPIDLLYIDADHSYEAVCADLAAWVPFVQQGGWVSGHDYDNPECPGVRKAVDERFNHVILFRDKSWAVKLT
jgi:predicted O-methyltransferase YrrM